MAKVAKRHSKTLQKASKKSIKKAVKSRLVRKLQKTRPKRYMNPFLCFAHEERTKAKGGKLLADWKVAHKGLGAKWRALGAGKAKFQRHGKVPAFAMFVKECPQRKEVLPAWRSAHKGLGGKWRGMDKASKARYAAASKQMKGHYDHQMVSYRSKMKELLKSIRNAKKVKRSAHKQRKLKRIHAKKSKVAGAVAMKALKRKVNKSRKKSKGPKKSKSKAARKSKKVVERKINARIRATSLTSRALPR